MGSIYNRNNGWQNSSHLQASDPKDEEAYYDDDHSDDDNDYRNERTIQLQAHLEIVRSVRETVADLVIITVVLRCTWIITS